MHSAAYSRGIVTPNNGMRPKVRGQGGLKTNPLQSIWTAFAPKFSESTTHASKGSLNSSVLSKTLWSAMMSSRVARDIKKTAFPDPGKADEFCSCGSGISLHECRGGCCGLSGCDELLFGRCFELLFLGRAGKNRN